MVRYNHSLNRTVFKWESGTFGSQSGAAIWLGLVTDATPDENTNVIPVRYMGTDSRNVSQWIDGAKDVSVSLSYHPQDWRGAVTALGENTDAGSPSPYTHVVAELSAGSLPPFTSGPLTQFPSYTLELGKKAVGTGRNFVRTLTGVTTDTWTLNGTQGEMLTVDVDAIAQDAVLTTGALTAITEVTTRPFLWRDVRLHIPSGTVIQEMKSFSLSVNNNLEAPHYLNGSQTIAPPIPTMRDYEFTTTLDSVDNNSKTFWESYLIGGSAFEQGEAGSEFNMMLEVNADTGSRDAFFILSGCKLIDFESPNAMEGQSETTLTIRPKNMVINVNDTTFKYNPF